jgi:hypothetical protein
MLKNPCKATRFYFDSHDCRHNYLYIKTAGWLALLMGYEVLLAGLFQHICLRKSKKVLQRSD